MVEDEAEHCPALEVEGMDVAEAELGYPFDLDPLLNSEGNACKQRWVTRLY